MPLAAPQRAESNHPGCAAQPASQWRMNGLCASERYRPRQEWFLCVLPRGVSFSKRALSQTGAPRRCQSPLPFSLLCRARGGWKSDSDFVNLSSALSTLVLHGIAARAGPHVCLVVHRCGCRLCRSCAAVMVCVYCRRCLIALQE